jgi:hypothetical protein
MVRVHLAAFLALIAIGTARSSSNNDDDSCTPTKADLCVFSPNENPYGKTYSDWAADWWQWALSQPIATNPLVDTTGVLCAQGQFGKVWFLAGVFSLTGGVPPPVHRTCAVPAGKALLFPVLNSLQIAQKSDSPQQQTLEFLRTQVSSSVVGVSNLTATIDGCSVQDIMQYLEKSTPFTKVLPDDNIYNISRPLSLGMGVDEGWYLVVKPLAAGKNHTIQFGGSVPGFSLDITYDIIVASSNESNTNDD